MRLIHYGKYAGVCYAKRRYRCPNGVTNEQSTDSTEYFSFTQQHFYELGRQLARL
jgi:hypothetical protein